MRKLLLVMLIPILVLGVMGGGKKIDPDVQTDYTIQGAWAGTEVDKNDDYIIIINAATLVVKYVTDVSTPYRTEFSATTDQTVRTTQQAGDLTLFDYQTNDEIATIHVALSSEGQVLTISATEWNIEEYYYSKAFPKEGTYQLLALEGEEDDDDDGTAPDYSTAVATDFTVAADGTVTLSAAGTAKNFKATDMTTTYAAEAATAAGDVTTKPTAAGTYSVWVKLPGPKEVKVGTYTVTATPGVPVDPSVAHYEFTAATKAQKKMGALAVAGDYTAKLTTAGTTAGAGAATFYSFSADTVTTKPGTADTTVPSTVGKYKAWFETAAVTDKFNAGAIALPFEIVIADLKVELAGITIVAPTASTVQLLPYGTDGTETAKVTPTAGAAPDVNGKVTVVGGTGDKMYAFGIAYPSGLNAAYNKVTINFADINNECVDTTDSDAPLPLRFAVKDGLGVTGTSVNIEYNVFAADDDLVATRSVSYAIGTADDGNKTTGTTGVTFQQDVYAWDATLRVAESTIDFDLEIVSVVFSVEPAAAP
jgi:hypothetical protein